MMSNFERLVYMANQIVANLAVQGDEQAIATAADHIGHFWDPRMRAQIYAHIDASGEGLSPLALAALLRLRDTTGMPDSETRATEFNAVDEAGHSDAG